MNASKDSWSREQRKRERNRKVTNLWLIFCEVNSRTENNSTVRGKNRRMEVQNAKVGISDKHNEYQLESSD